MKAQYIGTSDEQVRWGACSDPRGKLKVGTVYEVERQEVHSWHTKLYLNGIEGGYNSVCFDILEYK